jgi:hypothetical protein
MCHCLSPAHGLHRRMATPRAAVVPSGEALAPSSVRRQLTCRSTLQLIFVMHGLVAEDSSLGTRVAFHLSRQ